MSLRERLAVMSEEKQHYMVENLPSHLVDMGDEESLEKILTTFDFLQAKVGMIGVEDLIRDYERAGHLSDDPSLQMVESAIRMSAHVLATDESQLASQMLGRLSHHLPPERSITDAGSSSLASLLHAARLPNLSAILPQSSCLDAAGGSLLRTFVNLRPIYELVVTLDNRYIITDSTEVLKIWDFDTGEVVDTIQSGPIKALTLTPDGKQLIAGLRDSSIKIWDFQSRQEIRVLSGHTNGVLALAVSPDGKYLVSGSGDRTIKVWDLTNGQEIRTLEGHTEPINSVVVTPDGSMILSGDGSLSGSAYTIRVWDAEAGNQIRVLTGHTREITSLAVTPDSRIAISGDLDGNLFIWDLKTEERIHSLHHDEDDWINAVAVTPDGKYTISGLGGGTLAIWDIISGKRAQTFERHSIEVNPVVVTHDGQYVVSGSFDGTIKIWTLKSGTESQANQGNATEPVAIAMTPDETAVVCGGRAGSVIVWDVATGTERQRFSGHKDLIVTVLISPDGRRVISASISSLMVWDIESGHKLHELNERKCSQAVLASNGKHIISVGTNAKVWDIELGTALYTLPGFQRPIAASTESSIFIGCVDQTVLKVWDIDANKELHTLSGHPDKIIQIAISSDGKIAVSASARVVNVWNIETGEVLKTLEPERNVTMVAITPDGKNIIVEISLMNPELLVWNLENDTQWRAALPRDRRGEGFVKQFSDRRYILTAGWGGSTFIVWDINTGEKVATFTADREFLNNAVAVGKTAIVTGDSDGHMYFLRLYVP